jgi:3-hydroxyisobutyrate dehydrogenase-like beta-hydroxyacid dehydrogenase
MKLGFIGLGSMGLGMARNLLKAGHEITVYNRTWAKAEALAAEGAKVADSPVAACGGEAIFTMLADDAALEAVVFGDKGILTAGATGLIHVSMSTISPALSRRLAIAHAERGQGYLAAPVFGRPEAAAAAKLIVVAAGKPESVERCRPALEAIGQKVFDAGADPEKANLIKVSGNFMIAAMLETLGEVFAVLRKSGVDPKLFLEIVNGNLFRSPVYELYGKAIAEGRFEPAGFKLRLGMKDVKLALAAAEEVSAPMPLGSLLRDHFLSGVARGYGDIDWAGLSKVIAEDAGLKD